MRLRIITLALLTQWQECLGQLQHEIPAQQFNTWIRPLEATVDNGQLVLSAPNRFIRDWVRNQFLNQIDKIMSELNNGLITQVEVVVGESTPLFQLQANAPRHAPSPSAQAQAQAQPQAQPQASPQSHQPTAPVAPTPTPAPEAPAAVYNQDDVRQVKTKRNAIQQKSSLSSSFVFENFVEGKSNQLALAAAKQVAENAGGSYNPLFIYGGVGLGKTHLMHAVGNELLRQNPNARVMFLTSERFVHDMVKAFRLNAMTEFKRFYRSLDALLIDDIQFFAGKDQSQEEFFHTFNTLLENSKQIILTCDRYPKEIDKLEERLKSRFGWGLTIAIEPPDLETRVAILMKKAEEVKVDLPEKEAFFIAQKIRSNVRELEGALKRVIANAQFTGSKITTALIKDSLKDLFALQDKLVSIDNIQRTVAEYYNIKFADLSSKSRQRSIARPRQMAMALSKELTNHSLPEIGKAFGGRDHSTVVHACKRIKGLQETDSDIAEDYKNLLRLLTT